jgi:hypothetical protein
MNALRARGYMMEAELRDGLLVLRGTNKVAQAGLDKEFARRVNFAAESATATASDISRAAKSAAHISGQVELPLGEIERIELKPATALVNGRIDVYAHDLKFQFHFRKKTNDECVAFCKELESARSQVPSSPYEAPVATRPVAVTPEPVAPSPHEELAPRDVPAAALVPELSTPSERDSELPQSPVAARESEAPPAVAVPALDTPADLPPAEDLVYEVGHILNGNVWTGTEWRPLGTNTQSAAPTSVPSDRVAARANRPKADVPSRDSATPKAPRPPRGDAAIVCPMCQERGHVRTKSVKRKKGVSGAKATGAVITGGFSVLATGLSRKEKMTNARCSNCGSQWDF